MTSSFLGGSSFYDRFVPNRQVRESITTPQSEGPASGMAEVFGIDTLSKMRDAFIAQGLSQAQMEQALKMMDAGFNLSEQAASNQDARTFDYTSRYANQQFGLQNRFANNQFSRDLTALRAGTDEAIRRDESQGLQARLQEITSGEQDRLQIAAQGDQNRQTQALAGTIATNLEKERGTQDLRRYAGQGLQDRLSMFTQGSIEGSLIGKRGLQDRKLVGAQAKAESGLIADRGSQDRQLATTQGRIESGLIADRGKQERKITKTQGKQERLNIAARGDQERQTYDANDLIDARREERARARSMALARSA